IKGTKVFLENVSNYINIYLDNYYCIILLFLDLGKAFDIVNHEILHKKCTISEKLKVKLNDHVSECVNVARGTPQSSVLGSFLYILFIDDIFSVIRKCNLLIYADDAVLISTHKNVYKAMTCFENMQYDLNLFRKWSHDIVLSKGRGGGIVIFWKSSHNFSCNKVSICNTFELLCRRLEIGPKRTELMISCIYRPPHTNVFQFINELSNHSSSCTSDKGILVGDINIDLLSHDYAVSAYVNTLRSFGYFNCIHAYTREETRNGFLCQSLIYHLFLKGFLNGINAVIIQAKISDHYLIGVDTPLYCSSFLNGKLVNNSKIQRIDLKLRLLNLDFTKLYGYYSDINNFVKALTKMLSSTYESCYEIKTTNLPTTTKNT
ncbi:hypothetical protein J437_LFUL006944, partial [Ladona fulva]